MYLLFWVEVLISLSTPRATNETHQLLGDVSGFTLWMIFAHRHQMYPRIPWKGICNRCYFTKYIVPIKRTSFFVMLGASLSGWYFHIVTKFIPWVYWSMGSIFRNWNILLQILLNLKTVNICFYIWQNYEYKKTENLNVTKLYPF